MGSGSRGGFDGGHVAQVNRESITADRQKNVLAFLYRVLHNLTLNYLGSARIRMSIPIDDARDEAEPICLTDVRKRCLTVSNISRLIRKNY